MEERDHFGSFLIGFLSGAILGAVATLLYAPKSGQETRAAINTKKDELMDKANLSVDDAYKQAESAAREARDKFENLAATTRERAEDASRRGHVILEKRIHNLKKMAENVTENVTEDAGEEAEILMPTDTDEA